MIRVNCIKCIHYYVTWETAQPHGCRAYGFKSKAIPSMVVKQSSGLPCQSFQEKQNK